MNQELGIKNNTIKIKTFTDLLAWQEGHRLVLLVYKITNSFPKSELFALVNQLRRAVVSITSNIAEGFSRQSYSEKVHFYSIAQGSVTEIQNQLIIARDIGYINIKDYNLLLEQSISAHKTINGLIKKIKNYS